MQKKKSLKNMHNRGDTLYEINKKDSVETIYFVDPNKRKLSVNTYIANRESDIDRGVIFSPQNSPDTLVNNYINGNKEYKRSNFNCRNKLDLRDSEIVDLNNRVSFCSQACHSIPLIFKNFYMKISDHMLLGGEHMKKISPGFNSPIVSGNYNDLSPDEKKEIVMNSPSFGMFSLFKYHIKRGYRNEQLKKENKIYLSHIFSLICALPIMIFIGQWMLFIALVFHEAENYGGEICPRTGTFANKLMISGISIIYFARSFFIWDKLTNSLSLKKMNRVNSYTSVLDTFQEFSFILLIYGANIWVVYYEDSIQDMILNSLAMEFLMMLDNEFEELYFQYLPGAAEDIYDNVFVSYYENIELLEDRKRDDKCFRCFSCAAFIPYKLLVLSMFLFPIFCLFMTFVGPICK